MKIGIDATSWWNNRGFGRFTRELLHALFQVESEHSFVLFTDQPLPDLSHYAQVSVVLVKSSLPTTEAAVADGSRSAINLFRLYRAVAQTSLDVMFFPTVYSWFPVPRALPTMVTLHDAIAEHYPRLIFASWRSRLFWMLKVKFALWTSRRILTISQAAKEEIVEYIGAKPENIDIASAAPNPQFRQTHDIARMLAARDRANLPAQVPIIVFVGGLAPHKNLHRLLDGFESAIGQGRIGDTHLALVGDFRGAGFLSNYDSLRDRVMRSPQLRSRVHFTGYLSDEDLVALYSSALAVAMPSYSEGFGLPAVEAMACAAPILSSNQGALPEVVGDAGIYFDPFDSAAIARAIIEMIEDPARREQLRTNAIARARLFTWERAARMTLAHLEAMQSCG